MANCVQEALKSGVGVESADDFWGGTNCVDDFFVDQLLDFSNGFTESGQSEGQEEMEKDKKNASCVSQEKLESSAVSSEDDFGPLPSVPAEGLESLEWLSHFVEDSFSDYPVAGKLPLYPVASLSKPAVAVQEQLCFTRPVQTKARTKRGRTGVRVWPVLSPSLTESSTSSTSSTSSMTSFPPRNPWEVTVEPFLGDSLVKKHKRKLATIINGGAAGAAQPRRCSHCDVTKTPQWRAGPMGSKTLCNACGVRFKSGRLLPEYRPACSPTFSLELHSNNHRKVLEMRRKNESEIEGSGVASPVRSF
ncbi:GATA transcription factor 5 [Primulina eburnea]|uniref:GATA transcription factor 5 n=1 Tax=Primulina eburnea TaxID=1245227 RepID=UPI003C6C57BC